MELVEPVGRMPVSAAIRQTLENIRPPSDLPLAETEYDALTNFEDSLGILSDVTVYGGEPIDIGWGDYTGEYSSSSLDISGELEPSVDI